MKLDAPAYHPRRKLDAPAYRVPLGRVLAALVAAVAVAACSGGSDGRAAPADSTTTASTTSTTVPTYTGDPDSEFCQLVTSADERPVLDPFEAGLEANDVEVRFRALQLRFQEFDDVAPPELAPDLDAVVASLDQLGALLASAGYDFTELAQSEADVAAFDDPAFAETAARISAYRDQVCAVRSAH